MYRIGRRVRGKFWSRNIFTHGAALIEGITYSKADGRWINNVWHPRLVICVSVVFGIEFRVSHWAYPPPFLNLFLLFWHKVSVNWSDWAHLWSFLLSSGVTYRPMPLHKPKLGFWCPQETAGYGRCNFVIPPLWEAEMGELHIWAQPIDWSIDWFQGLAKFLSCPGIHCRWSSVWSSSPPPENRAVFSSCITVNFFTWTL